MTHSGHSKLETSAILIYDSNTDLIPIPYITCTSILLKYVAIQSNFGHKTLPPNSLSHDIKCPAYCGIAVNISPKIYVANTCIVWQQFTANAE